jgi:hypothetical protein
MKCATPGVALISIRWIRLSVNIETPRRPAAGIYHGLAINRAYRLCYLTRLPN